MPVFIAANLYESLSKVPASFEKVSTEAPKTVKEIIQVVCGYIAAFLRSEEKDTQMGMNQRGLRGLSAKDEELGSTLRNSLAEETIGNDRLA